MTDRERTVLLREFQDFRAEVREDLDEIKAETSTLREKIAMVKGGLLVLTASTPFLLFALTKVTGS